MRGSTEPCAEREIGAALAGVCGEKSPEETSPVQDTHGFMLMKPRVGHFRERCCVLLMQHQERAYPVRPEQDVHATVA